MSVKGTRIMTSQMVSSRINSSKAGIKSMAKSFSQGLNELLINYADNTKDLKVRGATIPAARKYEYYGTLLIGREMNDKSKALTAVLDIQNSIFTMEKKITSKVSA